MFIVHLCIPWPDTQLTKYTYIRQYPLLETSLFVLMSYSTFLAAEAAEMTGKMMVACRMMRDETVEYDKVSCCTMYLKIFNH